MPAIAFLLGCLLSGFAVPAESADWRTLVQPIGTENTPFLIDPATINAGYPAGQGPWDESTTVTSITTTTRQSFVRFYNPTAISNPSKQEGSWVMRASEVRGLTPAQVREKFALPNLPTMMTLGLTTTGGSFYTGVAGPIVGWGAGGGQQSQQKSGPYTAFFNGQAVMASILDYRDLAASTNGSRVAAYLMAHSPAPYSDMETVYDTLDVLYNPANREQFDAALAGIGPGRFDDLYLPWFDAVMLHQRAISDRLDRLGFDRNPGGVWASVVRGSGREVDTGFEDGVAGVAAGIDRRMSERGICGFSLAWMQGNSAWNGGSRATSDYYRGSVYLAMTGRPAFLQLTASAGLARERLSRRIDIATFYQPSPHGAVISPLSPLSRTADSSPGGWDAGFALRGGTITEWGSLRLLPAVETGYLYQSRRAFGENGAGSLDLQVSGDVAATFHAGASLRVERPVRPGSRAGFLPYVQIGWAFRHRLDDRRMSASLNGWSDLFTVDLRGVDGSIFSESVGATLLLADRASWYAELFNEGDRCNGAYGVRTGLAWGW